MRPGISSTGAVGKWPKSQCFGGLTAVGESATVGDMEQGSTQLGDWLDRSRLDQRQGAKALGIHYTTLNKLLSGIRSPGRETAIAIEAKTGIPVAAWSTRVGTRKKRSLRMAVSVNVDRAATHV